MFFRNPEPPGSGVDRPVCVVGAGPVGLTLALALGRRGVGVVLLDRGDETTLAEPGGDGMSLVGREFPASASRGRGVGGTSGKWRLRTPLGDDFAQLPALDVADFEFEPPGLPGWPLGVADVAPYFERAARACGVRLASDPVDPSPFAPMGIHAKEVVYGSNQAFLEVARQAVKADRNIVLVTRARVVEIRRDGDGAVSGVKAVLRGGRSVEVRSEVTVLATGGIENARLLMAMETSGGLPFGLPFLGRCFMEHLHCVSGYVVPKDRARFEEPIHFGMRATDGYVTRRKYHIDPTLRRRWTLPSVTYELSASSLTLREGLTWGDHRHRPGARALRRLLRREEPLGPRTLVRLARDSFREVPLLARSVAAVAVGSVRRLANRRPRMFKVRAYAEQLPDPRSRIGLTSRKDEFGVPVASVDWRLSSRDTEAMRESWTHYSRLLERSGFGRTDSGFRLDEWTPRIGVGFHHMGTTRMSDSPRHGVVDRDCRVHGCENLYVAGTSVFSTGGSQNPTFTAVALAERLADHVASKATERIEVQDMTVTHRRNA